MEDLKGDPILCRDGSNSNVGRVLSPHKGNLGKVVERWDIEGIILLLMGDTVLGTESTTSPYMRL